MPIRRYHFLIFAALTPLAAFAQTNEPAPTVVRVAAHSTNGTPRKIFLRPDSPVSFFRGLLGMKPAERERFLAQQSPEQKKIWLAKIQEYEAMPADERELRLRHTQLRWDLLDLMKLSPVARVNRLASIPSKDRTLLKDRLRLWDEIPPHLQKQFLEHESTIDIFLRLQSSTPQQRTNILKNFSAEQRAKLDEQLKRWQSVPAGQREEMCNQFHKFFELTDSEKKKTLSALSETERRQMEKTLEQFGKLSPEQRRQCVGSFEKFASMSSQERAQFLKNAERWQSMSPGERKTWRDLVQKLPELPPLPPGFQDGPPLPPSWKSSSPPQPLIVSTNSAR